MTTQAKPVPHIHAEIIKAWADGAEIEVRRGSDYKWHSVYDPRWESDYEFRVKPAPKPDVFASYEVVEYSGGVFAPKVEWVGSFKTSNLKLWFNGETGELKKAEVL